MPESTPTTPAPADAGLLAAQPGDGPKPDPASVLFAAANEVKADAAAAAPVAPAAAAEAKPDGETKPADPATLLGEEAPKPDGDAKPAPIDYKLEFPTGYEPNEASVASFKTLISGMAEGKGISEADANALIKFDAEAQTTRERAISDQWENTRKEWREQIKLDPEIGGDKLKAEVLPRINKMLVAVTGSPAALKEFKQQLDATGMGDHPVVIRTFNRIAQALTEGGPLAAGGPAGQRRSAAEVLFGNSPKPN